MTDVLAVIGYSGFAFVQPGGLNRIMPIQEVASVLGEPGLTGRRESLRSTLLPDHGSTTDPDLNTPAPVAASPVAAEPRPRANARVHIAEIGFLDE